MPGLCAGKRSSVGGDDLGPEGVRPGGVPHLAAHERGEAGSALVSGPARVEEADGARSCTARGRPW